MKRSSVDVPMREWDPAPLKLELTEEILKGL
jgi:hypothetical protein